MTEIQVMTTCQKSPLLALGTTVVFLQADTAPKKTLVNNFNSMTLLVTSNCY